MVSPLRVVLWIKMGLKAQDIVKHISAHDIYSSRVGLIPSPTREHVVPQSYLQKKHVNDLNNIFICTSAINTYRGKLSYGMIDENDSGIIALNGYAGYIEKFEPYMLNHPDFCVKTKKKFLPPQRSRGAIARTCMYMADTYSEYEKIISENVLHFNLAEEWDYMYPPMRWEIMRANKLIEMGYPANKYVKKKGN